MARNEDKQHPSWEMFMPTSSPAKRPAPQPLRPPEMGRTPPPRTPPMKAPPMKAPPPEQPRPAPPSNTPMPGMGPSPEYGGGKMPPSGGGSVGGGPAPRPMPGGGGSVGGGSTGVNDAARYWAEGKSPAKAPPKNDPDMAYTQSKPVAKPAVGMVSKRPVR